LAEFNEPSGIATYYNEMADDVFIFIADCNNHSIRKVLLDQGEVTTIQIKNIIKEEEEFIETLSTEDMGSIEDLIRLECDADTCFPRDFSME
jgi:hypothetical protein